MIRRRALAALAIAACLPLLAGCPMRGAVTNIDKQRYAVLQHEKIVAGAVGETFGNAAFTISKTLPPSRGHLDGTIVDTPGTSQQVPVGTAVPPATKTDARTGTAAAIGTLRGSGWTVYFVGCTPPSGSIPTGKNQPWPNPDLDHWSFDAFAYKVLDGVSYFAQLNGIGFDTGAVRVDFTLLAPNEHEAVANLFPDLPPPVSPRRNCVESPAEPTALTHDGPVLAMSSNGPQPGVTAPLGATGYR